MDRRDIDLNMTPHPLTGDLSMKSRSSAIKQSLRNIVLTNYYERGFSVQVGTDLRASLFENISPLEAETIRQNIKQAVRNFEPNVEVIDVYVEARDTNEIVAIVVYNEANDPSERAIDVPLNRIR